MAATRRGRRGCPVVVAQTTVRHLEAQTAAGLADLVGLASAQSLGASVIFPLDGHFVGFNITPACTVALLVLPFFLAATLIIASRRVPIRRTLMALVVFSAVIFAVNQVRLAVAVGAMRVWGFESGYERSHVFLGTVVSTVGVLGSMARLPLRAAGAPSAGGRRG